MSDAAGAEWCDLSFSWQNDREVLDSGTAQAGAASTITLRAGASAVDDFYNGGVIEIIGGTGVGQSRQITDYVGSTQVATVAAWVTNPGVTSVYIIHPAANVQEEVIEGTLTLRQIIKIFLAVLAGESTGGGTTTVTFRDNADTKARVTATVDSSGNRTAMTLDGT